MANVIVLDDEQARVLTEARGTVELGDRRGRALGKVQSDAAAKSGFTEEEIADTLRRIESDEPRYTTREVLEYLQSLDSKLPTAC